MGSKNPTVQSEYLQRVDVRGVNDKDLHQHRQMLVRDSGERRNLKVGWLGSEQRLTISTMSTRIQALCQGLGFAWSPLLKIHRELEQGLLKPLPLEHGSRQYADLYLVITDAEGAGPVTRALAQLVRQQVDDICKGEKISYKNESRPINPSRNLYDGTRPAPSYSDCKNR